MLHRLIALVVICVSHLGAVCVLLHPGIPETSVNASRVRDILLGRISTWSDGTPVTVVLVANADCDAVLQPLTGRDSARLLRGWKRLAFTGAGVMPLVVENVREAGERVAELPGALVVVDTAPTDPRWRVIELR